MCFEPLHYDEDHDKYNSINTGVNHIETVSLHESYWQLLDADNTGVISLKRYMSHHHTIKMTTKSTIPPTPE